MNIEIKLTGEEWGKFFEFCHTEYHIYERDQRKNNRQVVNYHTYTVHNLARLYEKYTETKDGTREN